MAYQSNVLNGIIFVVLFECLQNDEIAELSIQLSQVMGFNVIMLFQVLTSYIHRHLLHLYVSSYNDTFYR